MTEGLWRRKRVLVTGADGFVGSHLTESLVGLGARVTTVTRATAINGTTRTTFRNLPRQTVDKLEGTICCDVASGDFPHLIVKARPDVIFHLAAVAHVPFSFDRPLEVLAVNVNGTIAVLEAARRIEVERVVCTSSSEVYGTALTRRIDESHPLNPTSPYAASKAAADRYCFSYVETYKLPVATIRPFNTYGPRHTYDVIPHFIDLALKGEPITVSGSGEQTRDFMYITDAVEAFLVMGSHPDAAGKVVNFGTGADISINTVARLIKEIARSESEIVHAAARAAEVDRLCCDWQYAHRLFGWAPRVSVEQGLRQNIEYAREHSR